MRTHLATLCLLIKLLLLLFKHILPSFVYSFNTFHLLLAFFQNFIQHHCYDTMTSTTTTKKVWNKRSLPIRQALTEFGRLPLDVIKLVEGYDKFEGDFDSSLPQRPSKESKKDSRDARACYKHRSTAEEMRKARVPCKFFLRLLGGCRYGHSCRFLHDHAALKRRLLRRQNLRDWTNLPDSLDCEVDMCIDSRRSHWDSVGEDMREEILRRREKKKKKGSSKVQDEWDFM